jgi:hypothetical protein
MTTSRTAPTRLSAEEKLLTLYDYWRVLTVGEGDAIRAGEWDRVAEFQEGKRQLREEIAAATEELGPPSAQFEQAFAAVGEKLILLELENARALAAQRQIAEQAERELEQISRNLRRVHQAYGHGPGAAWQSYS